MPVQTDFGRAIEAIVADEFAAAGVILLTVDEPAKEIYIEVTFRTQRARVRFKLLDELTEPEKDRRAAIRRNIDLARRMRKSKCPPQSETR